MEQNISKSASISPATAAPLMELEILLLAPTSNDARLTARFLHKAGFSPTICPDLEAFRERMRGGCGALLLAEEALAGSALQDLVAELEAQPSWSDLPVVLITSSGLAPASRSRHLSHLYEVGNIAIIERPVRPETLVNSCEVALRSRRRQYQVRDLLLALESADRRKDEFLAMLAHELRNPLAAVANASELLDTDCSEDQGWAINVIKRQTAQLTHLIEDLLDVSRITTGKIRLRKELFDLATVLDCARNAVLPLIHGRGHRLLTDYESGSLWIYADPARMEQIILNLLTNAAKYTSSGGLITLNAHHMEGVVLITVRDNGMGIPPHLLPEMFKLFAQGEQSIARSEGGLGIGLTIVQKLVELHGGKVEAHSDGPNLGSSFTVHLPSARPPLDGAPVLSPGAGARKLRLLIVDDNVDSARGMAKLLTRAGHEIQIAHDGEQALARSREHEPDAVLLDIGLPGMDGFEVARRMRRDPSCSNATIIAVTGYGQPRDRERAREAGCHHHLVKPVNMEELMHLLLGQKS